MYQQNEFTLAITCKKKRKRTENDIRLQHDKSRAVALGLAVDLVAQRAGLVGFDVLGGVLKELFDLRSSHQTCERTSNRNYDVDILTYPVGLARLGGDDGHDIDSGRHVEIPTFWWAGDVCDWIFGGRNALGELFRGGVAIEELGIQSPVSGLEGGKVEPI